MTKVPFKVFTLKMARALTDQGFKIIGTVPNSQKPWLNAYLFDPTEEFMIAFKALQGGDRDG